MEWKKYSSPCDEHPPYKQPPSDEQPLALAPSQTLTYRITPMSTQTPTSKLSVCAEWGVAYSRDYCIGI